MRRILKYILLFFLCIICLFACTKPYPQNLLKIEKIIAKHPEKAFEMLDSLKPQIQQGPQSTIMYYNLLLTEACERCNIPYLNDSLIPSIVQYYEKTNEKDKLMKSYYFMGQRYLNLNSKEAPTAFTYFLKALDTSTGIKECAFRGRIHNRIGESLININLPQAAIPDYQKAFHFFQQENDSFNSVYTLQNVAKAYDLLGKTDSTLYYLQKAYKFVGQNREIQKVTILEELANTYTQIDRYNDALKILQQIAALKVVQRSPNYNIWGNLYLKKGQKDSASIYFEKEINNNNLLANQHAYWNLFQIEKEQSNYKRALDYLEKHLQCSDSINKRSNIQSLQRIKALYNLHFVETEKENLRNENLEQRTWIVGIMVTTAILLGAVIQYYRVKKAEVRKQEEKLLNVYNKQYLKSQQHIEDNKKRIEKLEEKIGTVLQEKDELHQKLLLAQKEKLEQTNQAIEISRKEQALLEESLRKSDIYAYCYRAIEDSSVTLTDDDWNKLTLAINETYDNFTNRLFVLHPSITSMELHICLLLKIQLPTSTISQLVYRTQSAISMSRKQLYKKIFKKDGAPALLDEFILSF